MNWLDSYLSQNVNREPLDVATYMPDPMGGRFGEWRNPAQTRQRLPEYPYNPPEVFPTQMNLGAMRGQSGPTLINLPWEPGTRVNDVHRTLTPAGSSVSRWLRALWRALFG